MSAPVGLTPEMLRDWAKECEEIGTLTDGQRDLVFRFAKAWAKTEKRLVVLKRHLADPRGGAR